MSSEASVQVSTRMRSFAVAVQVNQTSFVMSDWLKKVQAPSGRPSVVAVVRSNGKVPTPGRACAVAQLSDPCALARDAHKASAAMAGVCFMVVVVFEGGGAAVGTAGGERASKTTRL